MQHFQLSGKLRASVGKVATKAVRRQGLVPCNLYGLGMDNIQFTVDAKELKGLTNTPASYIVDLVLDNGNTYTAIIQECQWHPVSDECLHVDFLLVNDVKPVTISVPVIITGHAVGVQKGGKFYQSVRKLKLSALVKDLPDNITVNIDSLDLDKQIKVADISLEGVTMLDPKSTIICGVKTTRNTAAAASTEEAAA